VLVELFLKFRHKVRLTPKKMLLLEHYGL